MPFSGDYDGSIVAVLEQLRLTADLEGLAVLDLSQDAADAPVAYSLGLAGRTRSSCGQALLTASPEPAVPCHRRGQAPDPGLPVGFPASSSRRAAALAGAAGATMDRR